MDPLNEYHYQTLNLMSKLIQAQYWHDPLAEDEYVNKSIFLSKYNNQGKFLEKSERQSPKGHEDKSL